MLCFELIKLLEHIIQDVLQVAFFANVNPIITLMQYFLL